MALSVTASLEDVQDRLGRPMGLEEESLAKALLSDAAVLLESELPKLNQRLEDGDVPEAAVKMVHANMVVRVVRNPEGIIQEVDGNYSRTLSSGSVYAGGLVLLPQERKLLGDVSGMVGSIRPTLEMRPAEPILWR